MSEVAVLNQTQSVSVFGSMDAFKEAQRMIAPLMGSTMVPDEYKGNGANCMVAMEMSYRTNKSVLEIMQNMQMVKGKVGWKSSYVIMSINRSGNFKDPLEFVFSEDRQACYAIATRKNGKEVRGTAVSIAMARSEGWYERGGSKWKTMPEQMLMYRSATMFANVHCPEVLAGVQTADEITDIGDIEVLKADKSAIDTINSQVAPETQEEQYDDFQDLTEKESTPQTEAPAAAVVDDDDF